MGNEWIFFVAFAVILLAGIIAHYHYEQKRREALFKTAFEMGLDFSPSKDETIPVQFQFLNKLNQGRDRYAFNIIKGHYAGHRVIIFDYHYKTESVNAKGSDRSEDHYLSVYAVYLPDLFPELIIAPESLFSKVAQAFGYQDIDFESYEFSRKFCVRCGDKKFAYDICHARAMEYLLTNDTMNIEIDTILMASIYTDRLKPGQVEPRLNRLIEFRNLIPEYVLNRS